jgi:hypothetical protein
MQDLLVPCLPVTTQFIMYGRATVGAFRRRPRVPLVSGDGVPRRAELVNTMRQVPMYQGYPV